jgi:Mn2+/Fe2+ NRAMP family transporter
VAQVNPQESAIDTRSAPNPQSVWSHLGPGFIITATIVGSGELIVTPKLGADVGFILLWFIVLGCAVKVFVQIALARTAIATGATTLEALDTLPGPRLRVSWVVWLWLGMFAGLVFQVGGIVGGIASVFAEAGIGGGARLWALPVGLSCALLLAGGRYATVERLSTVMVVLFTLSALGSLVVLQWTPYAMSATQIAEGLRFGLPDDFRVAFAAFGVIGVGASELIYYPYWCLEKGYARHVGRPDGTPDWGARARGWMGVMKADAGLSLVLYTSITVAFYLLGAAVLHARQADVTNAEMIHVLSLMFRESYGEWILAVFLAGAFFVLYSTFFGATAANARLLADGLSVFRFARFADEERRRVTVRTASVALAFGSTLVYLIWPEPVTLVLIGATGQALMLPFLGWAAVLFNRRAAGSDLATPRWETAGLVVSALLMGVLGAYQLYALLAP